MIELTRKAAQMMQVAVLEAPTYEVLGFGKVTVDNGIITVTDIIIPPQKVGVAHTDLENNDLQEWLTELAQSGTVLADWPLWWHSHCGMSVTPSAQDMRTLALLADSVPNLGWFAGIVTNVRAEYHGWINTTCPVDLNATLDVFVDDPVPASVASVVKSMMSNVRRPPSVVPPGLYQERHAPPTAKIHIPLGLPDDASGWESWTKAHPQAIHQRLHDMSKAAIEGLRGVFGADIIDALLERDDELVAVMGNDAQRLNQVGKEMIRKNSVRRGGKRR